MQRWMLDEIARRGYRAIVTDGNPHAPARWLGASFYAVSTYDILGHLELAKRLPVKPCAVLTVAADVGPTVSALAAYYDLPACSLEAAIAARHKIRMRERWAAPHPVWRAVLPGESPAAVWRAWKREVGLEAVVKAVDGRGSRGFAVLTDENAEVAIARARAVSSDGSALIEERLYGEEVAIDTFVVDGRAVLVNSASRRFSRPGVEQGHTNPGPRARELEEIATAAARAIGVTEGPFKLDLIQDPRYGWCVLEMATRLSGGFDHFLTATLGPRIDVTAFMLDYALGQPLNWSLVRPQGKGHAAAYAPEFRPGRICGYLFRGSPEIPRGVYLLEMQEIRPLVDSASRPCFAIGTGLSAEEAWQAAKELGDGLEPIYL